MDSQQLLQQIATNLGGAAAAAASPESKGGGEPELAFFDAIERVATSVAQEASESIFRNAATAQQDYVCERLLLLVKSVVFVGRFIVLLLNATVTIFGLGVGVGLILGDSVRGRASNNNNATTSTNWRESEAVQGVASLPTETTNNNNNNNGASCSTSNRRRDAVEEPPPSRQAVDLLPAQ